MNRLPRTVQKISAGATSALKNAGRSCEMTGLDAFLDFSGFDAGVYESTLSASGIRDAAQISLASICLDQLVSEFYGVQTQSGSLLDLLLELDPRQVGERIHSLATSLGRISESSIDHIHNATQGQADVLKETSVLQFSIRAALNEGFWQSELVALQFCLHLIANDTFAAAQLIQHTIISLTKHTSLYNRSIKTSSDIDDGLNGDVIAATAELLSVLQLLSLAATQSQETQSSQGTDTTGVIEAYLITQLHSFAVEYRALLPLLAVTIRNALLDQALYHPPRYDIVSQILAHPMGGAELERLYLTLSALKPPTPPATTNTHSGSDAAQTVTGEGPSTVQAAAAGVEGDPGYEYLRGVSREDAIKVLFMQPEGSFLLRPHESQSDQYFLSFRTSSAASKSASGKDAAVKHAIIRRTTMGDDSGPAPSADTPSEGAPTYQYQCGKIGPCSSMMQMLREISAVLETPLRLPAARAQHTAAVVPGRPVRSTADTASAIQGIFPAAALDLNASLWETLKSQASTMKRDAQSTAAVVPSSSTGAGRGGRDTAWTVAEDPQALAHLYGRTLEVLALSDYAKQLAPAIDLCNALATVDTSGPTNAANSAVRAYYRNFSTLLDGCVEADFAHGSFGLALEAVRGPFTVVFAAYQEHSQQAEQRLQAQLLPTPPFHAWASPPLSAKFQALGSTAPTTEGVSVLGRSVYAPADELLVAEHLWHLLSLSVGAKDVRLSSSSGAEHVVLPHCLAVDEVHRVLQQWRELFIQHESAYTQRLTAKRLAERAAARHAATMVLSEELTSPSAENEYETPIVSRRTVTTSATLSLDTYAVLKRINALIHIDVTTATKDYLRRLIAWLSDELQLIYEVTRPGDFAFSAVQRFYSPRHPWEVKVLRDFTQAAERVRLGRCLYNGTDRSSRGGSSGGAAAGNGGVALPAGAKAGPNAADWSAYFTQFVAPVAHYMGNRQAVWQLWRDTGAERYLRAVISSAVPNTLRRDAPELRPALSATSGTNTLPLGGSPRPAPVSSAISTEGEGSSKHSTYHGTIETYMYRNNCCLRLGLPHRSVPLVQVDLYGLQEILAVRTVSTSVSHTAAGPHAPVSIPSGVSPITYMNLFNKPTVLAPTATTHAAAALDIYAVMRLAPARGAHSAYSTTGASTPFPYGLPNRSGANSGTSSPIVRGGFSGPLTAKNCPVGAVVTAVHKAEARRTPLEQSDPTAGTIGGAGPSAVVLPNAWYKQQQPAIARAVEYNWRDQALFRFALPEGQLYTHLPANTPTVGIHPYPEAAADSAAGVFPPTVLSVPPCYFETLSVLVIAVYERTFFADTLLGELELELAPLNTKRIVRGWYPLTLDHSISWLVYLQVRLKMQDVFIEPARAGEGAAGQAPPSPIKATGTATSRIIKQMDDF